MRAKLAEIKQFLKDMHPAGQFSLEVNYDDQVFRSDSSLEREVVHNIEHVIHHLAIIKIALLAYHDEITVPQAFGVAPSTLRYWAKEMVKA